MARIYHPEKHRHKKYSMLCILLLAGLYGISIPSFSQTTSYKQFSPEFQLNRAFSEKWAAELDLSNTFSNTHTEDRVFKTLIQGTAVMWAHYYLSPRWKISSGLGYYYNHNQPDIGQYESN